MGHRFMLLNGLIPLDTCVAVAIMELRTSMSSALCLTGTMKSKGSVSFARTACIMLSRGIISDVYHDIYYTHYVIL